MCISLKWQENVTPYYSTFPQRNKKAKACLYSTVCSFKYVGYTCVTCII